MKSLMRFSMFILVLGGLLLSCSSNSSMNSTQYPTSSIRVNFLPGDATSTPRGNDISYEDFQAGIQAYRDRDFEKVKLHMEKIVAQYPELAPPHWYLGRSYYELGDYQKALEQMQISLSIDPNYALAYADRGLIYSVLGNEKAGFEDYQKALELDPSLAKVHHNLGKYYSDQGNLEKSYSEYDISVQIDPTRFGTWTARGELLEELGRYSECIESTSTAISINKDYWSAYIDRSLCYAEYGSLDMAHEDLSVVLTNASADSTAMAQACYVAQRINMNNEAIEFCTISINLTPSDYKAYINRGDAYYNIGRYQDSLSDFTKALEFGDIPVAYGNRGNVYSKLGEYDKAIEDYERSIAFFPERRTYYYLGSAYMHLNKFQDALDAFESGDAIDPKAISTENQMSEKARAYFVLDHLDLALELYDELIEKFKTPEAYYFRARIFEQKGDVSAANENYDVFLEIAENKPNDSYLQMLAYDANKRKTNLNK